MDKAIKVCTLAHRKAPRAPQPLELRSRLLLKQGRGAEALRDHEVLVHLEPERLVAATRAAIDAADIPRALTWSERAAEELGAAGLAVQQHAWRADHRLGDVDAPSVALARLTGNWLPIIDERLEAGWIDGAKALIDEALHASPDDRELRARQAVARLRPQAPDVQLLPYLGMGPAPDHWKGLYEPPPDDPVDHAVVKLLTEGSEAALAVDVGTSGRALAVRGEAWLRAGDWYEAERALRAAVEAGAGPLAKIHLTLLLAERGRIGRAWAMADEVIAAIPSVVAAITADLGIARTRRHPSELAIRFQHLLTCMRGNRSDTVFTWFPADGRPRGIVL